MSTVDRCIAAYEDQARVASYDASMEIMTRIAIAWPR
jgi:hypothetical protein